MHCNTWQKVLCCFNNLNWVQTCFGIWKLSYRAVVYGTGIHYECFRSTSDLPCLVVQLLGDRMNSLDIWAYGIVRNFYLRPSHVLSLVLNDGGIDELKFFLSGIKSYLQWTAWELAWKSEAAAGGHHGGLAVLSWHDSNAATIQKCDQQSTTTKNLCTFVRGEKECKDIYAFEGDFLTCPSL
jgi:hypothetical protein